MDYRETKAFCRGISNACRDGIITKRQQKTLVGQAKRGDVEGARRGFIHLCAMKTRA